jgi:hypothetical protein
MNALVLEMVAARAAASGNEGVVNLLTRLRERSGDFSDSASQDLLAKLGQNNPMVGVLTRHMAEAKANTVRAPVVIDADQESADSSGSLSAEPASDAHSYAASSAINELRDHAQNMFAELQILRQRSDDVAAALGACCLCWGHDANCRNCHGRGGPGFSLPDENQFGLVVLPAIRMINAHRTSFNPRFRKAKRQTPKIVT